MSSKGYEIETSRFQVFDVYTPIKDRVLTCILVKKHNHPDLMEVLGLDEEVDTIAEEVISRL